ncbi:MAG: phosphatidylserine decarboxylase [Acidobacteriota bacterium]|nr:MAG: phosphatidylserine decarboxylase [Acidobacteriota bacterium]
MRADVGHSEAGPVEQAPACRRGPWRRRWRLAREGRAFVLVPLGVAAGTSAIGWWWAAIPALAAGLFCAYFFRDPDRIVPDDPRLVVAPADGRVTKIDEAPSGLHIVIFLSLFDVHVNRSPVAGVVRRVHRKPGRFLAAFDERAGTLNARNELTLDTRQGRVEVSQITGLIARRIVCRVRPGDRLAKGERFGLIRFGSRTDLFLPAGTRPLVAVGEKVRGGTTPVAQWSAGEADRP